MIEFPGWTRARVKPSANSVVWTKLPFSSAASKADAKANYTDVLTSEQSLLSAQLQSINDRLQQLQSVVNLYASLGGGWK